MFGDHKDKNEDEAKDLAGAVQAMASNTPSDPQSSFAPDPAVASTPPISQPTIDTSTNNGSFTPPAETPPDLVPSPAPAAEPTEQPTEVAEAASEQSISEPVIEETPASEPEEDMSTPASTDAVLSPTIEPVQKEAPVLTTADTDGLLDIKQNALEQLKPLVDHLEHTPEEKFDALMMMIRASDDQTLVQPAFEVAQKITDDTKRAEALLDVVNEINYLTSNQQ